MPLRGTQDNENGLLRVPLLSSAQQCNVPQRHGWAGCPTVAHVALSNSPFFEAVIGTPRALRHLVSCAARLCPLQWPGAEAIRQIPVNLQ